MRDSEHGNAKLLDIAGAVAGWVNQLKHASEIVAAATFVLSVATNYIEAHKVAFYAAVGTCVLSLVIRFACGFVEDIWRRRQNAVLQKLSDCEDYFQEFMAAVVTYNRSPPQMTNDDLIEKHEILLARLCGAAVFVFDLLKPWKAPFEANIKRVILIKDKAGALIAHFSPLVNSYATDEARLAYDAKILKNPPKIASSYAYDRMFKEEIGKDYFIHHNTRKLLKELSEDKYVEPNEETADFYLSLINYPIAGKRYLASGDGTEPWFQYGDVEVAGLICVDSKKRRAFKDRPGAERDFDLLIVKQLMRYAFSSFQIIDGLIKDAPTQTQQTAAPVAPEANSEMSSVVDKKV